MGAFAQPAFVVKTFAQAFFEQVCIPFEPLVGLIKLLQAGIVIQEGIQLPYESFYIHCTPALDKDEIDDAFFIFKVGEGSEYEEVRVRLVRDSPDDWRVQSVVHYGFKGPLEPVFSAISLASSITMLYRG